jgi:hypothetical protein
MGGGYTGRANPLSAGNGSRCAFSSCFPAPHVIPSQHYPIAGEAVGDEAPGQSSGVTSLHVSGLRACRRQHGTDNLDPPRRTACPTRSYSA